MIEARHALDDREKACRIVEWQHARNKKAEEDAHARILAKRQDQTLVLEEAWAIPALVERLRVWTNEGWPARVREDTGGQIYPFRL